MFPLTISWINVWAYNLSVCWCLCRQQSVVTRPCVSCSSSTSLRSVAMPTRSSSYLTRLLSKAPCRGSWDPRRDPLWPTTGPRGSGVDSEPSIEELTGEDSSRRPQPWMAGLRWWSWNETDDYWQTAAIRHVQHLYLLKVVSIVLLFYHTQELSGYLNKIIYKPTRVYVVLRCQVSLLEYVKIKPM